MKKVPTLLTQYPPPPPTHSSIPHPHRRETRKQFRDARPALLQYRNGVATSAIFKSQLWRRHIITSLPLRVKPVYPFQHFRFPDADWGPLHPDPQSETVEFLFFNFQRVHVTEEEDKQERSCLSKKIYQCVTKECFSASGTLHFIEEAYCFKSWSRHPLPRLYSVLFVASYY